jgi:hypothetical protein
MKPKDPTALHRWLLLIIPRLAPIVLIIIGWRFWGWPGAILGLAVGCLVWFLLWIVGYYFFFRARLQNQRQKMAVLSTEELKKIAVDPSCRDMAFAIGELERRGVKNIRPSAESLLDLLTSDNPNWRAVGFSNLSIMHPSVFKKIATEGCSSSDAPEVWRERIAALGGKY